MLSTVVAVAALAGSLVNAAPVAVPSQPSTYYTPYLEPYDVYHLRYLALSCQTQHNTSFFEDCCHPLLSVQKLSDRPDYCTPNATEIASASAYISSTAAFGAPTKSADAGDSAPAASTASSALPEEVSEYSAAQAAPSTSSSSSTADAPTTQNNYAAPQTSTAAPTSTWTPEPTTTSTKEAPQTTTQASSGGGAPSGAQTGGYATYFYQGGNAGACGTVHSDSDKVIAIDSAWWGGNFGVQSSYCGKWITIQNTNNGKTVTAVVADVCPTCVNGNSLDLSVGAFTAIASESDGMVPITWWFN